MLSSQAAVVRVAARTGYPVIKAWAGRNHGQMGTVRGVMRHHTGTGVNYARLDDYPTLRVVQVGRPDLPGPLCTWGIGRSGAIYVVNDQVAWHAGAGNWRGVTDGNGHFWAIEAESDGTFWTPALIDCYPRLVASALYELGLGWEWTPRHAGYARPVGRKTDTAGMDEALFERRVRSMLADPRTINRNYQAAPAAPANGGLTVIDAQTKTYLDAQFAKVLAQLAANQAQTVGKLDRTGKALLDDFNSLTAAVNKVAEVDSSWFLRVDGRPEVYEVVEGKPRHVTAEEWRTRGLASRVTPVLVKPDDPIVGQLGLAQDPTTSTTGA